MFNPDTATASVYMPSLETAARSLKVEPIIALVHSDVEIEAAIIALARRANTVRDLKPSQAPLPTRLRPRVLAAPAVEPHIPNRPARLAAGGAARAQQSRL